MLFSSEDEEKNETPDEQLVVRPPEPDREKRTKKKVPMVNPFTVICKLASITLFNRINVVV